MAHKKEKNTQVLSIDKADIHYDATVHPCWSIISSKLEVESDSRWGKLISSC